MEKELKQKLEKLESQTACPYCRNIVICRYYEDKFAQQEEGMHLFKPTCRVCGIEVKSFDNKGAICEKCKGKLEVK